MTYQDRFILLKYGSIIPIDGMDPFQIHGGILMECRSLVVDLEKDCIALCPYRKFFNLNENPETDERKIRSMIIGAETVEFTEKIDGSMQSARWYDNRLLMSGTRAVDPKYSYRLRNGLDFIHANENYLDMIRSDPDTTFIFEYVFPDDEHVVRYNSEDYGMYLTGARDCRDGREWTYKEVIEKAERYGVRHVTMLDIDLDGAIGSLDERKWFEAEGYVMSIDGFKTKIKFNDYVLFHARLDDVSTPAGILRAYNRGYIDDIISKLDGQKRERIAMYAGRIKDFERGMSDEMEALYSRLLDQKLVSRKDNMVWMYQNIESPAMRSLVRRRYLGNDYDIMNFVECDEDGNLRFIG